MEFVLAHGASGSAATMQPHVLGLRSRGFEARAINLPVRRAELAVAAFSEQLSEPLTSVVGGHSYGGRVASLLAADEPTLGLVLLSYPLHRPGQPAWLPRTEHWLRIRCPVLLVSGEADPFARIDLLRRAVAERLPNARLVTYPGLRHGLAGRLDVALDVVAEWARELPRGA